MVSIIIPAYNVQEYIRECLESVLAQSFHDIEVIVVNDGSTDGTRAIVEEMTVSDSRVRLFDCGNHGSSVARNIGIDNSTGEYIMFVDADDCLMPDAIGNLLDTLKTTDSGIAIGGFTRVKNIRPKPHSGVSRVSSREAIAVILYQTQLREFNNSCSGKIFRREVIGEERFTPGLYFEDIDFFYRVFLRTDLIGVTNADVYFYRLNPKGKMHSFSSKRIDVLEVTETMEECFSKDRHLLAAARDRRLSANFNILLLLNSRPDKEKYSHVTDKCWDIIRNYRLSSLTNKNVRLTNKAGVVLSYLGKHLFLKIAPFVYSR